jgi:hypothetical protein
MCDCHPFAPGLSWIAPGVGAPEEKRRVNSAGRPSFNFILVRTRLTIDGPDQPILSNDMMMTMTTTKNAPSINDNN